MEAAIGNLEHANRPRDVCARPVASIRDGGTEKKKKNTARGVQYLMSAEGKQTLNTKNVTFYSPQTENKTCENREIPMPRKRNKHNKGLREIKSNQNPQDGPCPWTCDGSGTKTDGYSPKKNDKPVLIR